MKNINKTKQLLLGLAMFFATNSFGQFVITPSTFGEFGSTDLPIQGIGIGNFPSGSITDVALHVNTNYLTTSINYPGIAFGEVFRTDAPDTSTYWRMLRNGTEAGKIYSLDAATDGDGYHFYIAASNPKGELRLNTGGDIRMTISSNGLVGINTLKPRSTLDVNGTITANQIVVIKENNTTDLLAVIESLQNQITKLEKQVNNLSVNIVTKQN